MNLEDLNLVELNALEVQEVEGGWPGIGWWMDVAFGYGGEYGGDVFGRGRVIQS